MKKPKNFRAEPFEYHEVITLVIEDLTNLGSGVGRIDGWVVFVPYALPGERVRARVWRNKKQYSDADLVEVLVPASDRVSPKCSLFQKCGGCQYQHYSYESQLEWKAKQIHQLLKKASGVEYRVNPCIGSDQIYHYRSKITPHFRRPPHLEGTAIGFEQASTRSVIDVEVCPIASERINDALPKSRELLKSGEIPFKRGGTLLLRDSEDGVITDMKAPACEIVKGYRFGFVAGEFFQNNPYVLPLMIDYAMEQATGDGMQYLVDAYCGVGVFGICGHSSFQAVAGVEVNEQAVEWALKNVQDNQIKNMEVLLGSAERIFENLQFPSDKTCVLMDPPRKGSDELFLNQLVTYRPGRIVYVSCGPDTQARDIITLTENGYEVVDVQPFDLFPHTRHIENIITLKDLMRAT